MGSWRGSWRVSLLKWDYSLGASRRLGAEGTPGGEATGSASRMLEAGEQILRFAQDDKVHLLADLRARLLDAGRQDDAEAGLAAHHPVVGRLGLLQREDFVSGTHAGERGELHRVLGFDGCAGRPAGDRAAPADQNADRDLERVRGGADDEQLPVDDETSEDRGHGLSARDCRQDDLRSAEAGELRGGILRVAVDRVMRAELARQRLLVLAARDRDGLEAHLRGALGDEMAEAAHAEHGDEVARTRAAPSERVVRGDAGAEERVRLHRRQEVRDPRQRDRGRDQKIAIAVVVGDSGNLRRDAAGDEVPSPARIAVSAVPVVPADPDTIFDRPAGHFAAERVDRSRELSGPALPTRSRATKCAIALTATAETVNPSTSNASKSKPPKR